MRLKEIRKERGLTFKALADLSGIPARTLQDVEARGDCRVSTALVLARTLNLTVEEVFGDCQRYEKQ